MLRSAVLGGGSIARPDKTGKVSLGPESMGASPGPACYGLGGDEATLTDALLVLGFLDPAAFLGGRRHLSIERAAQAIQKKARQSPRRLGGARPQLVRDEAIDIMADLVGSILAEARLDPARCRSLPMAEMVRCSAHSSLSGWAYPMSSVFGLSPVFSAFGSAISDVVHVYERGVGADIADPGGARRVGEALASLYGLAARDLSGEGFSIDQAKSRLRRTYRRRRNEPITVRLSG